MQLSRKTIIAVLLSIMSMVAVPAVRADNEIFQVTGAIVEVGSSIIVVETEEWDKIIQENKTESPCCVDHGCLHQVAGMRGQRQRKPITATV